MVDGVHLRLGVVLVTEKRTFGGASEDAPPDVVREVNLEQEPNGDSILAAGSLLDQLRSMAAEQEAKHTKDLLVGGFFRKQLWIRYKTLDPDDVDLFITRRSALRDRMEEDPRAKMPYTELNMDLMSRACVAVVGANSKGEDKEPLEDEFGKVKLEHRLMEILGMPVPPTGQLTAREVIIRLFGGNAMAVMDHSDELIGWMRDPAAQAQPGE